MKFLLIIVLFFTISFSASAQWWNISLKKHERFPAITSPQNHPSLNFRYVKLAPAKIPHFTPVVSDYNIELAEAAIMKTAQHNMRFRIYDIASYNFSDLAKLYIKQNRFSEAKWYLLQSSNISRQENDDKHTVANLMDLAMVKANLGDPVQAQQDLAEAQQIATSKCWLANVADIQKELKFIQQNKPLFAKAELRYASDAMVTSDKKTD
jgi:hypothetical protein